MRDNLFCPLIKQECKKDECVMWKPEACLISVYFIRNIISSAIEFENKSVEVNSDLVNQLFEGYAVALDNNGEQDAQNSESEAIFSKSADEFADEIIQFAKDENLIGDDEFYLPHEIEDLFWSSKGLEISNKELSPKYRSIKRKSWLIASTKLKKETKPTRSSWIGRDSANDNDESIKDMSNELLAEQLLNFVKDSKLGQNDTGVLDRDTTEFFWKSKGIQNTFGVSADNGIKIKQVEKLARDTIQQRVFSASNNELGQELAAYAKKKAGRENGQGVYINSAAHTFWRNKGLDYRIDSLELQERKEEVERLAQEIIDKDFHEYRDKRLETEKGELPKLIQSCAEWARSTGRSSVTIKDVEFFLLEKKIDILEATERALYLSTNNELKTRKRAS